MAIENVILLKVHRAGGQTSRRDITRALHRFPLKDRNQAFDNLVNQGLIRVEDIVAIKPGPYKKRITMTDKGKNHFQQLVQEGLVITE